MALVQAKCTNCGANLEVDSSNEAAVCQFCGTPFIVEKAINNYNTTNNIKADVVNVYGGNSADFVIRAGILEKYNGQSPNVVIPNNVTGIASGAFYNCKGLKSVVFPEGITYIGEKNTKLYGEIPNGAFEGCTNLKEIVFPESVVSIGSLAFADCTSLFHIILPRQLKEIESYSFYNCTSLTEINIPKSLKVLTGFAKCSNLKKIDIPDTVTEIGIQAFQDCSSLTEIIIPESINRIGSSAFEGCTGLNQVIIPQNTKKIDVYAFMGCNLNRITIESADTEISEDSFCDSYRCRNHSIKQINAPEGWKRKYWSYFECLTEYMPKKERKRRNKLNREYKMREYGCYVATCVYGSYNCPQVWTLRRYRDNTLAKTWYGRAFIHTYYAISPTIVKWFGNTVWFKKLWRGKLDKMVIKLNNDGISNTPYEDRNW